MTDTTQEHAESRATPPRTLNIPALSLVVMVGASGCGKSTFARRHFRPTEVLSSDACRGMVSDDENNQARNRHVRPRQVRVFPRFLPLHHRTGRSRNAATVPHRVN